MTVGSLFAGIGGFDLGLERAGMTVKWQVEIDPFCQAVLAKHWPDVRRYADVRTVGAHNLEPVDLICGGFPCQDISTAGRGAGLSGERSGLWSEYLRLIRELRPGYVVVENVAALLTRGMGTVLGDLAESGYDAEWDCIPASAVGAPHRRDRVWIVAYPSDHLRRSFGRSVDGSKGQGQRAARGRAIREGHWRAGDDGPSASGADVGDSDSEGQLQQEGVVFNQWRRLGDTGWWGVEPDVARMAYGVPGAVDRTAGIGNAIVPQIAEWIGRRILEAERVAA